MRVCLAEQLCRRNPLAQEHFAQPPRGREPVPGGMANAFYVSFWGQVTTANDKHPRGGPKRWVWLHSCWCRRLNRLGRLWSQVEAWYGGIWRVQVTIERWQTDGDGEWEPVEYL